MNTIKLYYDDPYMRTFEAVVMNCVPEGKHYLIKLNRTAFTRRAAASPATWAGWAASRC